MLRKLPGLLLLWGAAAFAGAPQLHLRDTRGSVHTSAEWTSAKAIVLFFVTTDCPIANSYVPEMNRIHDAYTARSVRFYAVQADTSIPEAGVAQYAHEFRYGFPLLLDPEQALIRLVNAT